MVMIYSSNSGLTIHFKIPWGSASEQCITQSSQSATASSESAYSAQADSSQCRVPPDQQTRRSLSSCCFSAVTTEGNRASKIEIASERVILHVILVGPSPCHLLGM